MFEMIITSNPFNSTLHREYDKKKVSELLDSILPYGKCVRLYNEKGEHKYSILRCCDSDSDLDIATPDGEVQGCEHQEYVLCDGKFGYWNTDLAKMVVLFKDDVSDIKRCQCGK